MKHSAPALLFCLLFAWSASGAEITETFFSRVNFASGTAVWNQALGRLHTTLHVMNYMAGFTPLDFSVGDGSDGAFDSSTYASFSQNGDLSGNIIRLDTSAHPVLNVTLFHLDVGWILKPVGPNPLVIHSLSDVIIEGEIQCQGDDGQSGSGATPGLGGSGRCGGQDGGSGGANLQNGVSGNNASVAVTGGQAGNFTGGAAVAGGGGGSWSATSPPGNGANSSGAGGQAGAFFSDPQFLTVAGGAGGGGGSGTTTDGGGGGGGGGGAVVITAVGDIDLGTAPTSATGFIFVNGGGGGGSNVSGGAGGGGGGGGGSVQVFVGGTINIYNTDISGASQGNGGTGGTNVGAAAGGGGGLGRSWFSSVFYNGIGFYTPAEELPVSPGNVEFTTTPETIVSGSYDTGSTAPTAFSLATVPISGDFALQAAGSSDDFVSDNTGFTSNFTLLTGKRYVKFMVTITTSNVNTPDMVSNLNITYTPNVLDQFKFGGGCGSVAGDASPWNLWPLLAPLIFLVLLKVRGMAACRVTHTRPRNNMVNFKCVS